MLHPSYTELMELINKDSDEESPVVGSRFSVVMAAAKRARQIIDNKNVLPEEETHKPLSSAIQEIWTGDVKIVPEETEEEEEADIRSGMDREIEGYLPDEAEAERLYAEEHPGEEDPYAAASAGSHAEGGEEADPGEASADSLSSEEE